jgi:small conductance mechanosensitive channel
MNSIYFRRQLVALAVVFFSWLNAAQAQPATQAPTTEQLQQLVATLKDDNARAQLVGQLQALIAAQNATQKPKSTATFAWLTDLPAQLDAVGGEILAAIPIFAQAPHSIAWLERQVSDPGLRERWLATFEKLALIFGAGIAADAIVYLLLRRPAARLKHINSERPAIRFLQLSFVALVELLPVLMFAGVATFVMPLTEPHGGTRGVAETVIAAMLWARGWLAVARVVLLTPRTASPHWLTEETRNYLYIWIRRFTQWAAYGYAASSGAWWLAAPGPIVGLLMRVSVLVLAILAIIFVLQNRAAVAQWLRGAEGNGRTGWRVLRNRLAETWHVLALVYISGTFGIYLLNAEGGLALLLRATALSLVVITATGLAVRLLERALQRLLAVKPELKLRFPGLEPRVNRYTAILRVVGSIAIYFFAFLALLQAWGLGAFTWLAAFAQHPATGHTASLALVIVAGLVLWEIFSSMIERRMAAIDLTRRSRARTLLPLLRTTVMIVLITIIGLMVLSEIGLNIAPLLAGAGIAGIAVGFGAQTLVKDLITGFLILLEDAFAVGDVVDVGNGHSGVVETISIRNFRLRDMEGTVHTIPFSMVTTIKNLTRDYSYYLADVEVSYREDTDEVVSALIEIGTGMRDDPNFGPKMLEPIEIIGVDAFKESSVVIKVRLKTAPMQQWTIGREFNRRMKKAFDQKGIELPFPHRTIYFGEDRQGRAPAAHIRFDSSAAPPPAGEPQSAG